MKSARSLVLLLAFAGIGTMETVVVAAEHELAWEFATGRDLPVAVAADRLERPYLYVALKSGGLGVLGIETAKSTPQQVAQIKTSSLKRLDVMNVFQHNRLLFLALGGHFSAPGTKQAGLAIVSVSDPEHPKVLSVWASPKKLKGGAVVVTDGRFAYLGAMSAGVMTFDVSDPTSIQHLSTFQPDIHFPRKNPKLVQHPNSRGLALRGKFLYVANDAGGLRILDMQDRTRPREVGRYVNKALLRKPQAYNNIVLDGNLAYIAVDYAGLEIVDISDPNNLRQIGWWNPWNAHTPKNLWFNSPGHTNQIALDAQRKLVYLSAGDSELQVVDVSKPHNPRLASHVGKPQNKLGVWGLGISRDQIYLTYIKAIVPFRSNWSGVKAVNRK